MKTATRQEARLQNEASAPATPPLGGGGAKYLQIASHIEALINTEALRIGDKLPSVRTLAEEKSISMGTAFQAYYHLEGKGLIESRPKSGYYVRFNRKRFPALPNGVPSDVQSHNVTVKDMIDAIYSDIAAPINYNFALGVPDVSLLPAAKLNKSMVHALRNTADHGISYENTRGNPELRKQVARLAFNWGGHVAPDDVIVTNGCLEAITTCLKAVTQYGDTVAVECPTYFGIYQAIESLGLKVVEISSCPVTGLDLECLQTAIQNVNIKAVVCVPNFSNPLGSCMPDEQKKKLVALITKHHIPLIEDDIYGELYFGKARPRTCKAFDTSGLVMHCSSLSKSLAPGYRIGWVLPGRFHAAVAQIKRMQNISCPTLPQAAVAHFLQTGRYDLHLRSLRQALHTQCLRYTQSIIEHFPAGTRISQPHGGFVLWLELDEKVDVFRLRSEALAQQIAIVPGKIFSASCNFSHCLRISFGKPWNEDIDYGLKLLGNLVKKQTGRV
ncbi:MAG TPA: PLP-dependent aminotransferase family protein [Flavisolibacter sp.]|nr:PLP-dependent aminotransferase family protein [Flavisolibacter sp.]